MSYSELKVNADREARTRFPRALVQLGGCTRTVGAGAVLSLLQATVAKQGLMTPVRVAGCDGACHEAPVVIMEMAEGLTYRLTNVGPADVNSILSFWLAGQADASSTWKGKPVLWPPTGDLPGFWKGQERRVMEHVGAIEPGNIDDYVARGGYATLNEVLHSMTPEQVVEEVVRADLRGRGGAYFPAGRKWQGARAAGPGPRYLIVNAEEGEPGIYKDRHVMEGSPFLLLEGLAIAAYAIGAEKTLPLRQRRGQCCCGADRERFGEGPKHGLGRRWRTGQRLQPGHRGAAGWRGIHSRRRERADEQHRGSA